jgi:hypothetical protein
MRIVLVAVVLVPFLELAGCTTIEPPVNAHPAIPAPIAVDQIVLSQPILEAEPQGVAGEPADTSRVHPWYISTDRAIRMLSLPLRVGRNKVAWFRPEGADLQVTGHRLDAIAPPMIVDMQPLLQSHQFCPSILVFPTDGYWEIVGRSDQSQLRAVVKVSSAE